MKVIPSSSARRTMLAACPALSPRAMPSRLAPPHPSPATLTWQLVRPSLTVCMRAPLLPLFLAKARTQAFYRRAPASCRKNLDPRLREGERVGLAPARSVHPHHAL